MTTAALVLDQRRYGAFNCFACGAKGGAHDAALASGRSPAMELLRRHGLERANERPATPEPPRGSARRPSEADLERYRQRLEAGTETLARLVALRRWTPEAIRWLGCGPDCVTIWNNNGAYLSL